MQQDHQSIVSSCYKAANTVFEYLLQHVKAEDIQQFKESAAAPLMRLYRPITIFSSVLMSATVNLSPHHIEKTNLGICQVFQYGAVMISLTMLQTPDPSSSPSGTNQDHTPLHSLNPTENPPNSVKPNTNPFQTNKATKNYPYESLHLAHTHPKCKFLIPFLAPLDAESLSILHLDWIFLFHILLS